MTPQHEEDLALALCAFFVIVLALCVALSIGGCMTRQTYISVPLGPHECALTQVGMPGAAQALWSCRDDDNNETFTPAPASVELPLPLPPITAGAIAF